MGGHDDVDECRSRRIHDRRIFAQDDPGAGGRAHFEGVAGVGEFPLDSEGDGEEGQGSRGDQRIRRLIRSHRDVGDRGGGFRGERGGVGDAGDARGTDEETDDERERGSAEGTTDPRRTEDP